MKHSFKKEFRRFLCFLMTFIMILTSMPVHLLAADVDHNNLSNNKSEIINNKTPVTVAKPEKGKTAKELIENPKQPAIYTLRTDYKVQRGEKYQVDYQPYIASVGEAATQAEKDKVKQTVKLPDLTGYEKPDDDYKIDYDTVKNAANGNNKTGNDTNGIRYQANKDFKYKAKSNTITIKHVFQDLEDFTKYTNPNGRVGEEGQLITTQNGNTGSTMEVSPLNENDPNRKGFVPEAESINMQVPENAENFILEYRYNRAHYDVVFDTKGGTALPARTLYYGQVIPKIADESIPTKVGGEFQGWKPSVDLTTKDGKTFKANEIIKVGTNEASKNLDANLIMPANKVTFTAVWKDKEKADYAVQFWAEKADHADDASLLDKYDYIGTRVYKDQDTGSRPNLDEEPVKGLKFPDLDQARLNKIWNGETFNRRKNKLLDKFFVYNQALTHDQNKDPENVNLVKSVDSTGRTVYNIYYDRQVYDLYFTKSNAQPDKNTFYPEIWQYDEAKGEAVMKGGPGNLYHYKARFNEMMYKWPNDAKQTKGFTPGYQSFGWGPNYTVPNWPLHLDTPPYRLNADEFLDMANYTNWGGYTKKIDKGDGTTMDLDPLDFKTLSFGIKQDSPSIPHHMDFWMDGFKDGETIIRYDLVRTKADTASPDYRHRYPRVQGFTPYGYNPRSAWPAIAEESEENGRVNEDEINNLNDERDEITPNNSGTYYNNYGTKLPIGQLDFISVFFSDADEFGDPLNDEDGNPIVKPFEENGYLRFKYTRNKYPLRFNYDPSKIKDDKEFGATNSIDTFYEFPLKALSPNLVDDKTPREEREYYKDNPKNLLDNPENLKKLGLTDLVFNDPNDENKLKVKRPDNLSDQMVFKGWALDPAGSKLVWENPKETMPFHPVNLYAKWGEPDYKWKVTFDPNGGSLRNIKEENLTKKRKKIQEGDIGQEEINTYAKKEANEGDKQIFTVIQRQKLVEPKYKPTRKGYDFMGWEVIRYKKDAKTGDYKDEIDNSYRETYKVPELYSFGNDVVAPVYLKAIWVPNARVDVKVEHYMLDKDYKLVKKLEDTLEAKRANYLVATTGDKQDDEYILAPHEELEKKLTGDLKTTYEEYNNRVKGDNTFFQQFRVEPAQILNTETNKIEDNPKVTDNIFKFFYRPYRQREYKVNYIDERFKGKETEEGAAIIDQELVSNGNRHYDARNYRRIPGWVLAENEKPQQQLFFDVNEKTNEFLGINGTGKDEITFYYKDVRVIEVKKDDPVPDGYVRVTFKADKGGAFTDKDGNSKTELYYDVIKGLKSDLLPVPQQLEEGKEKEEGKYYITPETGRKFTKWDNSSLLNKNTIINEAHEFTAYFEWSGLSASGLVRTEAFKDPKGTWTNDFAPTIDQLKKQLVWREKDQVKPLPAGAVIKLYDEAGNELTTDDQVFALVTEKKAADKDELVRTVNVKAKVTFKDGKEPQELDIPITVYKNVYEALNKAGDKPLFLKEAEGKKAEEGGLKDVTGDYVMVTIKADKDFNAKDDKIYWVNKNAWVEIPEVKTEGSSTFVNWTADKDAQNENGIFDFGKRHKFTEDTVISPSDAKDVVEQTDPKKKPDVPNSYVKVIVKTTDKATDETKFEKTFWVNPTKEVTIDVKNPTGKTVAADTTKPGTVGYTMKFSKWETEDKAKTWEDKILGQFTAETTIVAKYSVKPEEIKDQVPTKDTVHTPQGKTPTADEIKAKITSPEGKTIKEVKIVENPDVNNPGKSIAKVIVEYTDGSSVGTKDKPVEVPVEVHKNIIPEAPGGQRPKDALDNYVKVIFKAGTGGTVSGNLVYYVSPEVEVNMTSQAEAVTKTPEVGYFVNGEKWTNKDDKTLKGTFTDPETEFVFNFDKSKDIVEKTDDPNQVIPKGYVKVTLIPTDKATDATKKVYFVNPKAENVTITNKPEGKKEKVNNIEQTYTFKGWKVTKGTVASWTDENINGQFTQETEITAQYSTNVVQGELVPAPVAKKNVVTPKGDTPKPEDLIENKTGLPEGTTFKYTDDGTPDVNNPGKPTAKVEVKYPNGKTVVVEVPITVVDNVVPQTGKDKPLVPESYVKVIVDTTDKAVENTRFVKTFWVKPNVEVTIPDILAPTGKTEIIDGVTKKNNFVKWQLEGTTGKTYDKEIKDKFTATESKIVATYEQDKNVEPKGKNNQWIPQGSKPSPKDFIENPYNDDDPNNKDNLPPGTKIEFVKGKEPDTKTPGKDKETTIKITYPNGETKEVPVKYNVTGDVVEQKEGEDKPKVPENFVKVVVKTTDKATDDVTKTFWVNPTKEVTVPVTEPTGKTDQEVDLPNLGKKKVNYVFKEWQKVQTGQADDSLTDVTPATKIDLAKNQYTDKVTVIEAVYKKSIVPGKLVPAPVAKKNVVTPKGDTPKPEDLIENIPGSEKDPLPKGTEISYKEKPKVDETGKTTAKVEVKYPNGKTVVVEVPITIVDHVIPQTGTEKPKDVPNNYVQVTFVPTDKATDPTAKIFWVNPNKEVTIPVSNPTGKQHFTFKEWKIGDVTKGETYKVGTAKKFETATTITATYTEAENIIPYDPQKPITAPDGYVRVTFEADEGLTLSNVKYYYVKKNSGVTLEKLTKPNVNSKVGFEFKNWDKENTLKINDKDVVVKAKSTPIADVIEGKLGVEKPDGYITVTFKTTDKAGNVEKVVYINPNKAVELTSYAPEVKPITGYEFADWDRPIKEKIQYNDNDVITAKFNEQGAVIPKTNPDGTENKKPDGYKTVTFVIEGKGGKIADKEVTVYYVNPDKEVIVSQPKTQAEIGYEFDKWDQDTATAKKYADDLTVKGNFKKLADIIPSTDKDGKPNAKPEGYVTVTFDKGANGNLTGQTVYYVNPKAGKTLGNKLIVKPTVKAETGYKFTGWDTKDSLVIKADKTVTAKYEAKSPDQPGGTTPGPTPDQPGDKPTPDQPGDNPGTTPDQPGDKPGDNPGGTTPGGTTPGGTTPGDQPGTKPGENPETPGTVPENPGAIPGTKPGVVEKHGNRYVERVAGKNRVHTAISTSKRFFKKSKYVIIADSGNYPDALTATVLAHVLDAPILLNNTRYLEDDVAREIVRLGASEVIIVGGHKSISENVKSQLAKYDANKVQRIWGRDRYVTSSELAYEIERLTGKVNKAIIASGENFPDALATAPLGSKEIAPILLVTRNQMDKKVSKALKDLNIKRVYVAGGQNSVSKKLEAQLPQVIRRFSGQDRYETAILVASYTYPESKEVFVASGETFPDALVIGPVCARRKAPILLSKSTPVKVTDDYIEKSKIEYLYIIGGVDTIHVDTAHKYAIED
ncbi:cell wall-binding repeat-containing protein [Finegoldia magna]|uniref:cell wall-binding repeat-containing protein n=1 Tax=Finegoldia magna TaxID=1260 RepID=UPI0026E9ADA4|nr:cell wall-binding repeat-containing protein [Finegoldia magna]